MGDSQATAEVEAAQHDQAIKPEQDEAKDPKQVPTTAEFDIMSLGKALSKSRYFADAPLTEQAIVKVLAGRELGIGPIASMTGIYIVKGRVTLSANLMAATIKRSGVYKYKIIEHDNTHCKLEFLERDGLFGKWATAGFSEFTVVDAQTAGLIKADSAWKGYPKNMCFARAMSNGAKWYCPDVFGGSPVYTPDELGAVYDPETGEVEPRQLQNPIYTEALPDPKEDEPAKESDRKRLVVIAQKLGWTDEERRKQAGVASFKELKHGKCRQLLRDWQKLLNDKNRADALAKTQTQEVAADSPPAAPVPEEERTQTPLPVSNGPSSGTPQTEQTGPCWVLNEKGVQCVRQDVHGNDHAFGDSK